MYSKTWYSVFVSKQGSAGWIFGGDDDDDDDKITKGSEYKCYLTLAVPYTDISGLP